MTPRSRELSAAMRQRATGDHYDLIILGAGPAGVKGAVEAASRGQRVALIEPQSKVTGAPTGAHSKCVREAMICGAKTWDDVELVLERAVNATQHATARELRMFHVQLMKGTGLVQDTKTVRFSPTDGGETKELTFDVLMIATGSKANRFPPLNFDVAGVYDSDTVAQIKRIPKSILVQGAGIVGLEYALIFAKLGSKVLVVEVWDKVVPMLDSTLQAACLETLKQADVEILLKTGIKGVKEAEGHSKEEPKLSVDIGERVVEVDCIISGSGRHGCTGGLGLETLEAAGLKLGRGKYIEVNEDGFTGCPGVYAVGDVAGGALATVGQAMAVRAVRACFGSGLMRTEQTKLFKPFGIWTVPEIAWAGITEDKAVQDGLNVGTVVVEYDKTVRGCVTNEDGFLKLVFDRDTGKVLGVHIFGENSCDLVNYGAECVNDGDTIYDMLQMVFPAVTYHELYHLAATEAKIRLRGAKNLAAATAWKRMQAALTRSLEESKSLSTVEEALTKAFKYFDQDDSGYLSKPELKSAMQSLGLKMADDEIDEMVLEATEDPDDDNVDYEQFLSMLKG